MTLESYSKLRKKLYDLINFILVGKLGNFVFESALTDISILIAQKSEERQVPTVVWSKNERGVPSEALRELRKYENSTLPYVSKKGYSVYKPAAYPLTEENWKPISYQENALIQKIEVLLLERSLVRVREIFDVKQGIRTGNNEAFKISVAQYTVLPESEQKFFRPAIDNDAIAKGKINIKNYVWYPYNETGLLINSEEELQHSVPVFYQTVLFHYKDRLAHRARKSYNNWWVLSEHRDWLLRKHPKLVSTEFGKSDSFAFDEKGEFVIERGNAWLPKKEFPHTDSNYFYLAIFSSSFFDSLLSIYSKQLLSGWDLGKMFTKDIPIPSVFKESVMGSSYYSNIVTIGKQFSKGESFHFGILDELVTQYFYSAK